jgi:hypothetical protein
VVKSRSGNCGAQPMLGIRVEQFRDAGIVLKPGLGGREWDFGISGAHDITLA